MLRRGRSDLVGCHYFIEEPHRFDRLQGLLDTPLVHAAVVGSYADVALGIGAATGDAADSASGQKYLATLVSRSRDSRHRISRESAHELIDSRVIQLPKLGTHNVPNFGTITRGDFVGKPSYPGSRNHRRRTCLDSCLRENDGERDGDSTRSYAAPASGDR